ncbi:hypothetical protein FB645_000422 [Coemansia sp. IMI 203386]|nr:hypothetical protein FB645_000422 [Coemansia sp. IMI 203386]
MSPVFSPRKHAQYANSIVGAKHTNAVVDSQLEQPAAPAIAFIILALITASALSGIMVSLGPQHMEPVYGNVLPQVNFLHGVLVSMAIGGLMALGFWRRILATGHALATEFDATALLMAAAPLYSTYILSWSGYLGPIWGPVLTHCVLSFPVFALLGFVFAIAAACIFCGRALFLTKAALLLTCVLSVIIRAYFVLPQLPFQRSCAGLLGMTALAGSCSLIIKMLNVCQRHTSPAFAARASMSRFLLTILIVSVALASLFGDNHCFVNGAIKTTGDYNILSREESVTGWVIVSDNHKRDIRLLRSGHSIVGGQWKTTKQSIFGVFYYADAVRMIHGASRTDERALQIGLGAGISARSLYSQGVAVDVIEIDPAVHRAAEQFFDLPRNFNAVYLQDARRFIETAPDTRYNYIVHDVFTGGSVPASLFSNEAIEQVYRIMLPSGVMAMNFVGVPSDERVMAHIVSTLCTSFKHVRRFGEFGTNGHRSKGKLMNSMVNMMFFASNEHIEFRIPRPSLMKDGYISIRDTMLMTMLGNEIALDHLPSNARPLTDSWNLLAQWQVSAAIDHWHAMRKMLPGEYWLNY